MQKIAPLCCGLALGLLTGVALPLGAASLPEGVMAVPLAAITNDRDESVSEIELMLSEQDMVRGIYIATRDSALAAPDEAQGQVITLAAIETSEGVVVGQGQGVKAILLRGKIEPVGGNGTLVIRYLTNGIFRRYAECRIHLRYEGQDRWQLVNAYDGAPVSHIEVKTWALGISTLANVCPTSAE